jgi:hypothetical protein
MPRGILCPYDHDWGFISSPYLEVRMQAGKPMFVCELLRQDLKIEMNALDRNRLRGRGLFGSVEKLGTPNAARRAKGDSKEL